MLPRHHQICTSTIRTVLLQVAEAATVTTAAFSGADLPNWLGYAMLDTLSSDLQYCTLLSHADLNRIMIVCSERLCVGSQGGLRMR